MCEYGKIIHMGQQIKKTMLMDVELLEEARTATGASTDTETVRMGLESLVRNAAYQRLRALRGSEPDAVETLRSRVAAGSR